MKAEVMYHNGDVTEYEMKEVGEDLFEVRVLGPLQGATICWPAIDRPYNVILKEGYL